MESRESFPPEFQALFNRLPEMVDRRTAATISGGLVTPSGLATMDCIGKGPAVRFCGSRKVFYPRLELVQWLAERCQIKYAGE